MHHFCTFMSVKVHDSTTKKHSFSETGARKTASKQPFAQGPPAIDAEADSVEAAGLLFMCSFGCLRQVSIETLLIFTHFRQNQNLFEFN